MNDSGSHLSYICGLFVVPDRPGLSGKMASPKEGFLTDEQREVLRIAVQNAEVLSSSPKSRTSLLLPELKSKVGCGGKSTAVGGGVRHVRRSHSGKPVRVKKGEFAQC